MSSSALRRPIRVTERPPSEPSSREANREGGPVLCALLLALAILTGACATWRDAPAATGAGWGSPDRATVVVTAFHNTHHGGSATKTARPVATRRSRPGKRRSHR